MRENKKTRKFRRLLSLLLAVLLVVGMIPVKSTLAVEPETTMETEDNTESSESEDNTESSESEDNTESTESEANTESTESSTTPEESEETEPTYENSISGILWIDSNTDGVYNEDEETIADYPVYLYAEDDTNNAIQTATTDAEGKYLFEEIEPSRYVVGIKAEENGTKFLLPLVGVQKDNKFYFTLDYSKVISNPIDIGTDTMVENIDAGMRTPPGIQPTAAYTIDLSTVSAAGTGYTYASNILTFTTAANSNSYTITGTTTSKSIVVQTGVTVDISLSGASLSNMAESPFRLLGTANVNLILSGTNTLTCSRTTANYGYYNAALHVAPTATLTISGSGTLNATGGNWSSGIGGSAVSNTAADNAAGTIIINSGTVTATGGGNGAGIGGGYAGTGGTITINGGTVTGTGTSGGAGIGGGCYNGSGTITITGGTVTATSLGPGGAGIGSGNASSTNGTIRISGGRITAKGGGTNAPGIGSNAKTLNIGTVIFTGGSIYPTDSIGTVSVYPTPTNGSTYGAPDTVYFNTISSATSGKTAGQAFAIRATGTKSTYIYRMLVHHDGTNNAYPWVPSYTLLRPTATTSAATNITMNSATLNGTYNSNTLSGNVYYQYGTTTSYGSTVTYNAATTVSANTSAPTNITGLTLGTTYNYRIVIVTDGGAIVYGANMTFTTPTPAATTTPATNVTGISASLNGTYNTAGVSGTVQFEYSTSSTLATYTTVNAVTLTSSTAITRSFGLTGLVPGTTYYYRHVEIINGTRYAGAIVSFTTTAPAVTTALATNVTGISASLNGTYNTQGYASTVQFEYGTSSTLGTYTTVNASTITSSSITNRIFGLSGLTPATTYYYRLVIVVGTTRYTGAIVSFTTSTPTAVTNPVGTVTTTSAVLDGTYNTQGYAGTVRFEYSTVPALSSYTIADSASATVSSITNKTYTLAGLTYGTTYYYRIVTIVNGVRYEGAIRSFTTPTPNFTITEKYVDQAGNPMLDASSIPIPDTTQSINLGNNYSGSAAAIPDYVCIGYRIGSAGGTFAAATPGISGDTNPTITSVAADQDVYYIYVKAEGSIKIEKLNSGGQGLPDAKFQIEKLTASGGTAEPSFAAQTGTTDGNGEYTFTSLPVGIYRITEIEAPTEYSLLAESFEAVLPFARVYSAADTPEPGYLYSTTNTVTGEVTCFYYDITYTVTDQAELKMPQAGSTGFLSQYYLWTGLAVLLAAGGTFVYGRKRRRS